jgi:cyclophilin-like protein
MKIRLTVGDAVLTATLLDSKATREFLSLLPLSLTMTSPTGLPAPTWPSSIATTARRSQIRESSSSAGSTPVWRP